MKGGQKKQESSSGGNGRISVEDRVALVEDAVIEIKNAVFDIKLEMENFKKLEKQISVVVDMISGILPNKNKGVSNNRERIIINLEDSIDSKGSDCEIVNSVDYASRTTTPLKSRYMPPRACNAKKSEKKLAEPELAEPKAKKKLIEPEQNLAERDASFFNKKGLLKYIYGEEGDNLDDIEEMAVVRNEYVNRSSLRKLKPKEWLDSGVINVYVNMLTFEQRTSSYLAVSKVWFMPDHLAQFALKMDIEDGIGLKKLASDFLGEYNYGGSIEFCEKMFIPMVDVNHWYLLMVDFTTKCVVILDSLQGRVSQCDANVKVVLGVIQILLKLKFEGQYVENINTFPIQKPTWVPQQCNSYDCGVYMLKFMELHAKLKEGMTWDLDNANSDSIREQMLVDIIYYPQNYHRKWFVKRFGQPKKLFLYYDSEESS